MLKNITVALVGLVVGFGLAVAFSSTNFAGVTNLSGLSVGTDGLEVTGTLTPTTISYPTTATTTLGVSTTADFGKTIYLADTNGGTLTLPAATAGAFMRFVVGAAFGTANVVIDSAEGDNIEGALIVAGAVVDCDAEDQINFVNDGENLGDFVELSSDGTNWYIGASGALTAAKLTCTDPS